MNIINLPSEIICQILQHTDCHISLQYVCKAFANQFFQAFFEACANSPSLKYSTCRIQKLCGACPLSVKITRLCLSLKRYISWVFVKQQEDWNDRQAMLELKCESLTHVHQLESWLEDSGVCGLFARFVDNENIMPFEEIDPYLKDLGTTISEKANKIREWFSSNKSVVSSVKELDLSSYNHLGRLPKEIGLFICLEKLNLENNNLTQLPAEIGNLVHLQHLNLCRNNFLTSLPTEIKNLNQLQTIDLSQDTFDNLPENMKNLIPREKITFH